MAFAEYGQWSNGKTTNRQRIDRQVVVLPTYVNVGSEIGGQSKILGWKTSVIPTLSVQYATQLEVLIIEQEQECLGLEARVLSILSITSLVD